MTRYYPLTLALCAVLLTFLPAAAESFFVAPNGNDAWSGKLAQPNADATDGPFATLDKAVAAARSLGDTPRRIILLKGKYLFEGPVLINAEDSGLTIEAAEGEESLLIGGRLIKDWRREGDHLWVADVPEAASGEWDFRCLVVNGRYCPRARYPEEGTFEHLTTFTVPWMGTTGGGWQRKPTDEELTTMQYRPEDLPSELDIRNAEITVYHMWDESMVGIAKRDTDTHTLTFSTPTRHPPGAFRVQKYVVWNVREGMTKPGQWYLDRTAGKVVYWPLPDEAMATAEVYAPRTECILKIQGTESNPVRNVTVRGLAFSVTNTPLKAGGFGANAFEGAIGAYHTRDCALLDLEITNVGGQGIKTWNFTDSRVEGCHVHDVGACGMMPRGEGVVAADNHIHHVGLTYPSAIGMWASGKGAHIHHNTIHDTPYSAITCGSSDGRIESNHIYRPMQVLHDGAGIYASMAKNLVIRGNFVHDITNTGGYGASAYYLDEQCEGCIVECNLSVRVSRPSHNHWAKGNAIRNNVFVVEGDAELTFARSVDYVFERNVVHATGSITFSNIDAMTTFANNVLFSGTGVVQGKKLDKYATTATVDLEAKDGNTFADPLLLEYEKGLVRFDAQSPALKLGIESIDVSGAGVRGGRDGNEK
jgi:Right handed beta helix region/GH141 insertion domain